MNIIVFGANGQLGLALRKISEQNASFSFSFLSRKDIELEDLDSLSNYLDRANFSCIINASSYNKVDLAETERETASLVNHLAVERMAKACESKNATFIHVSTDYVFDGQYKQPYVENKEPKPLNFYGFSKMMGEESVIKCCNKSIVIRTSWVISRDGENFVPKILKLIKEKDSIKVVNDQISSPTLASDLANTIMTIITSDKKDQYWRKIFHYSSEGECSRYDLATYIKKKIGSNCIITPCSSDEFPATAKRPYYSYLSKENIKQSFQVQVPTWQETIDEFLDL